MQVESDNFCQQIIHQRAVEGFLDAAPIFPHVELLRLHDLPTHITGLVCQGTSVAGKQLGLADARASLVRHIWRLWDEDPRRPATWDVNSAP